MGLLQLTVFKIQEFLVGHEMVMPTVLLGLSGGPDSVFLFHALLELHRKLAIKLVLSHVNHKWRIEADAEELFCSELADKNNLEITVNCANELTLQKNGSLEALGREIRQTFFRRAQTQYAADLVCLAHHEDDLVETFFIRAIRGSSLRGLGGIREYSEPFYRPLLGISKQDILNYLRQNNIFYCTDQSNNSDLFLRNRIRNNLIPSLLQIDSRATKKIASSMMILQQESDLLNQLVSEKFELLCELAPQLSLNLKLLLKQPKMLQTKLLQLLFRKSGIAALESQGFFAEVLKFLNNNKSQSHQVQDWKIYKKQNRVWALRVNNSC